MTEKKAANSEERLTFFHETSLNKLNYQKENIFMLKILKNNIKSLHRRAQCYCYVAVNSALAFDARGCDTLGCIAMATTASVFFVEQPLS